MARFHGNPPRGLLSAVRTQGFEGAFGRMFPHLPSASFGASEGDNLQNLNLLGAAMTSNDPPKDGPDAEESSTPALYTYFGQFIDHDLTFDPASSLQRQNDPDALVDYRTPAFDLDNVYGRGPDDQPYMYEDGPSFLLGSGIGGGVDASAKDLPRGPSGRALIGDPRNDENSIVSQLQGLMLRFHNRIMRDNPGIPFGDAQQLVRHHYQYVVANDFLARIVSAPVLDHLRTNGRFDRDKLHYYRPQRLPFMPVEFSVAAYRLGHSMVRPGYRLNDEVRLPIFPDNGTDGLTGFRPMNPLWGIDWGRFIDIDKRPYGTMDDDADPANKTRLQLAYRIDTSLVHPLSKLPPSVASDPPPSLASRNLIRGWRMGLPTGQHIAARMGIMPLDDEQILIGQGVDNPDPAPKPITEISTIFRKNCPLWVYVLAEAMHHQELVSIPVDGTVSITTPKLGPVGGRIVAEVILGLMFADPRSILNVGGGWTPPSGPDYGLKDLVAAALG